MNHKLRFIAFVLTAAMLMSLFAVAASAAAVNGTDQTKIITLQQAADPAEPMAETSVFTGASNTADGAVISWSAVEGAASYRLFVRDGEEYELLTETEELSFLHTPLDSEKTYLYNIRALDSDGNFITDFETAGFANTFYAPPVIGSVAGTQNGVALSWTAYEGVELYRVYRSSGSGWSRLADTADPEYLDTSAVSGTKYSYTVRCLSAEDGDFLSYYNDGASISYVRTPSITSIDNTATGAEVTWDKPAGADKIRLYYYNGSGWTRIGETSGTSLVHDNLRGGDTYVYTVRGVDSKGNFVTDFSRDGWENTFIEPPVIKSLTNTNDGIEISWEPCDGAENYRVYYYGSRGWTRLAETSETSFVDDDVTPGYHYTYTVRCISPDGSSFTSYHNSGKRTQYVAAPVFTSVSNVDGGVKLTWDKPVGADFCRIYYKNDNGGWTRLASKYLTEYVDTSVKSGETRVYTIRALSEDEDFVSDYSREGWSAAYVETPVITSLTNTSEGVEITWKPSKGAEKYRVYYYGSRGWTAMTDTSETSYVDTDVKSGYHYTYTVRCVSGDGSRFMSYFKSGRRTQYVAPPQIISIENTEDGAKIRWNKVDGADFYRIYYKNSGGGWTRLASKYLTEYVDTSVKNNQTRVYTVRCLNEDEDFVSDYNRGGWSNTFFAPPELPAVTVSDGFNLVSWKAVEGAAGYRVYRKGYNTSWSRLIDSTPETSYLDTAADKDTLYAYTLRCTDESGRVVSDYYGTNRYYYNGAPASGNITVNGSKIYFEDGYVRQGYQKIDGKTYYYSSSGVLLKNGIVGSASEGYCYADKNGVIDFTYRNGVTDGGYDWNVLDGKAYKVSSDKDRTLFRALKLVYKVTDRGMTKAQKLRKCFDYLRTAGYTEKNPRIPDYTGMDWPIIYANDIFVNGVGNCLSFAAAFAYMAKAIGYENVYGCHSGGHGWAEIDGLVYDPEWSMHNFKYSYFGMTYSEPCDVAYAVGIAPGYAWMHIKI